MEAVLPNVSAVVEETHSSRIMLQKKQSDCRDTHSVIYKSDCEMKP